MYISFKNGYLTLKISDGGKTQKVNKTKQADDRKKINDFLNQWEELMAHLGVANRLSDTFTPRNIVITEYGIKCRIYNVVGLGLTELSTTKVKDAIESEFACIFITNRNPREAFVEAQFITKAIKEIIYEPIKLKPHQLYLGTSLDGSSLIVDMKKYPHLIFQGATNMGKTKGIDTILVNLISTCTPEEVELYIAQSDKCDQIMYQKCKHCKAYAESLEEILAVTNYLVSVVDKRNSTIKPLMEQCLCSNIYEYNEILAKKKINGTKWSMMYFVIDEYSTLMPDGESDKFRKAIKQAIQNNLERLIQIGRYVGVILVTGVQRATIDKFPSFLKAMTNTIVTYRVNNMRSSQVAIDSDSAMYLKPREFIVKTNESVYGKSCTITPAIIKQYIKPHQSVLYDPPQYNNFSNLDEIMENKSKKTRKTKAERRKTKENIESVDILTSYIPLSKEIDDKLSKKTKNNEKITENVKNVEKKEEINDKVNDIIPKVKVRKKPMSATYIEGWEDPSKKNGVKIIDETRKVYLNTEKPKKK